MDSTRTSRISFVIFAALWLLPSVAVAQVDCDNEPPGALQAGPRSPRASHAAPRRATDLRLSAFTQVGETQAETIAGSTCVIHRRQLNLVIESNLPCLGNRGPAVLGVWHVYPDPPTPGGCESQVDPATGTSAAILVGGRSVDPILYDVDTPNPSSHGSDSMAEWLARTGIHAYVFSPLGYPTSTQFVNNIQQSTTWACDHPNCDISIPIQLVYGTRQQYTQQQSRALNRDPEQPHPPCGDEPFQTNTSMAGQLDAVVDQVIADHGGGTFKPSLVGVSTGQGLVGYYLSDSAQSAKIHNAVYFGGAPQNDAPLDEPNHPPFFSMNVQTKGNLDGSSDLPPDRPGQPAVSASWVPRAECPRSNTGLVFKQETLDTLWDMSMGRDRIKAAWGIPGVNVGRMGFPVVQYWGWRTTGEIPAATTPGLFIGGTGDSTANVCGVFYPNIFNVYGNVTGAPKVWLAFECGSHLHLLEDGPATWPGGPGERARDAVAEWIGHGTFNGNDGSDPNQREYIVTVADGILNTAVGGCSVALPPAPGPTRIPLAPALAAGAPTPANPWQPHPLSAEDGGVTTRVACNVSR